MNGIGAFTTWIFLQLVLTGIHGDPNPCDNLPKLRVCNQTQYEAYRDCMEEVKAIRQKQQTLCPHLFATETILPYLDEVTMLPSVRIIPAITSVVTVKPLLSNDSLPSQSKVQKDDKDDSLENNVRTKVIPAITSVVTVEPVKDHRPAENAKMQTVLPSVQTVSPMTSVVTVKPLESNDSLPYEPEEKIHLKSLRRKVILQGSDEVDEDNDLQYDVPVNVTTVIRLTNIVNNTNVVNVPTNVNTTNVNNIHIYANITEEAGGESTTSEEEKCCTAVQPKKCHRSTHGLKCRHKKHHVCGPQCTAEVIHVQRRKRCDHQGNNCKLKLAYVPQPEKPTCVYIDQWPFVACGKPANMKVICDGCYDHYGQGVQQAYHGQIPNQCRGCYDDGFDQGPMYRRGPVLRPFYYHEPPCYLTGTCPAAYEDCGYGCYGHEMIDPAWGPPQYDPQLFDPKSNQQLPVHKCTVLSEDNTLIVRNCTDTDENLYAASPSGYEQRKVPHKRKYKVRQTMHQQSDDIGDSGSGEGPIVDDRHISAIVVDEEYDFNL